jgi:pimeloyl-ACP methyl ester carboxylesterase
MRSEGPVLDSVEALADWTLSLLDAVGVQRAALVGHSLGSLVALEAAARAPERVSHLAMIGTAVPMPVPQALLDLSLSDVSAAIDRVVMFSFSNLAAKPSFPGPGTWLRNCAKGMMHQVVARGEPQLFHTEFAACNRYTGGLEVDQMTLPRGATSVAGQLKAMVKTVPSGHYPMQEHPDAVLNALRTFVR